MKQNRIIKIKCVTVRIGSDDHDLALLVYKKKYRDAILNYLALSLTLASPMVVNW